jgi:Ni,Fe-hydrogenase III small subunit
LGEYRITVRADVICFVGRCPTDRPNEIVRRFAMNAVHPNKILVAVFAACASGGIFAAASVSALAAPVTPNSCITVNGGDYNACNVGNSGRGDLPYGPVMR